ncbi:MAG: hypothetical protein ABEI31_03530 [Halodesulfurarchaeum sp.]
MAAFDIALGRCAIRDDALVIDRDDPEAMGRVTLFRRGLRTALATRPRYSAASLGTIAVLTLVFVALLGYIYTANPAAAPLVVGLAALGGIVVVGSLEYAYRRAIRGRRRLRAAIEEDHTIEDAEHIPLEQISHVTERPVAANGPLAGGHLLLVHWTADGADVSTYLGFPTGMEADAEIAGQVFDQHGITVEEREQPLTI